MMIDENYAGPVLVAGSGKLASSVSVCLVQAGHSVTLLTNTVAEAKSACRAHFADIQQYTSASVAPDRLEVVNVLTDGCPFRLAVVITPENLAEKKKMIGLLESLLPEDATIAVNTESFELDLLQAGTRFPNRIVGANWTEPAHTTCFLELIGNEITDEARVEVLNNLARNAWKKDPYCLTHGSGIRHRLMSALIREALFLVENDYASVEDIDRACRNDAGHYLTFAGNCRYMDLMGTYAYGMVMQDLNRELAKDDAVAPFFTEILEKGSKGMENNAGFFDYQPGEVADWEEKKRRFSYQIQQLFEKYPFSDPEETEVLVSADILSKA